MSAPRSTRDSLTAVRVVDDDLARYALSFLRSRSVEKTPVHVLAIEHIRRVTPNFFVVVLVVLVEHTAGLPVTHDELLEDNRFHQRDIGFPFPEPLCTWNTSKRVMVGVDVGMYDDHGTYHWQHMKSKRQPRRRRSPCARRSRLWSQSKLSGTLLIVARRGDEPR